MARMCELSTAAGLCTGADLRGRLVQRARLLLQQRQIVQRVVDHVAADIGAPVAGDDVGAERDLDPVDIAFTVTFLWVWTAGAE